MTRINLTEVSSTNDYARALNQTDVVVTADYQTAGRGQGDNVWESEAGKNLLFSIKVSPKNVPANQQFVLSMAGAIAIKTTLDKFGDGFTLKWPNDIYYHDRKISGTLIETTIVGKTLQDCVFGIGVNVNQQKFHLSPNPVALVQITKRAIDRENLLSSILQHFETFYHLVEKGDYDPIYSTYNNHLYRRKKYCLYEDKIGLFEAQILHVKPNGHIVLQDKNDTLRTYEQKELKFIL